MNAAEISQITDKFEKAREKAIQIINLGIENGAYYKQFDLQEVENIKESFANYLWSALLFGLITSYEHDRFLARWEKEVAT